MPTACAHYLLMHFECSVSKPLGNVEDHAHPFKGTSKQMQASSIINRDDRVKSFK